MYLIKHISLLSGFFGNRFFSLSNKISSERVSKKTLAIHLTVKGILTTVQDNVL